MSMVLECIGCRTKKVFADFDPYPVYDDCQKWEAEKFRREHEETYAIRQNERDVVHDGHRESFAERVLGAFRPKSNKYKKEPILAELRWAVWERDNFTCRHCGSRRDLTVDHIYPESKGGESTLENCQTLCRSCNSRKGAR